MSVLEKWNSMWFSYVHGHNLVYNTCWEDPRIDRVALDLTPEDRVMVITSAGCNTLDYALASPKNVYAVDMNYRQNALLELKMAAIRQLEFDEFFEMFGKGRLPGFERVYQNKLRRELTPKAQIYWDEHSYFFSERGRRDSFYYHGTSGLFAWLMNIYLNRRPNLRDGVNAMLSASSIEEQQEVYFGWFYEAFWNKFLRWAVGRDTTLSLLGVPRAQRQQVERHYEGGIAQFVDECLTAVFAYLPLGDNYFWRVYLTGQYTENCCPEYLKRDQFHRLQNGLLDRVSVHTDTVQGFLEKTDTPISRFVLLDHMDWLSTVRLPLLQQEWQAIIDRAAPDARILWRSGGLNVDFVDPVRVMVNREERSVGDILNYNTELAAELHQKDRVHTYGSFYIADLATS
jgi:S-adenosylmethionine-diacylglycerol 3-amino-3-carboxypropyl transferase